MSRFKKGDKAVCMYNGIGGGCRLTIGETYTIEDVSNGSVLVIDDSYTKTYVFSWMLDTLQNNRESIIDEILK